MLHWFAVGGGRSQAGPRPPWFQLNYEVPDGFSDPEVSLSPSPSPSLSLPLPLSPSFIFPVVGESVGGALASDSVGDTSVCSRLAEGRDKGQVSLPVRVSPVD